MLEAAFASPYGYDVEKPRELLAVKPGRAQRMGNDLLMMLSDAPPIILHDDISGCDSGMRHCDGFWLVADLPSRHFYLVREYYYEGGDYYLIDDRTGRMTAISFVPIFSPDGQRFIVLDNDRRIIEVWRCSNDEVKLEWSYATDAERVEPTYRAQLITWIGDSITLAFTAETPDRNRIGHLTRAQSGWHLALD